MAYSDALHKKTEQSVHHRDVSVGCVASVTVVQIPWAAASCMELGQFVRVMYIRQTGDPLESFTPT
jgi:hypothetical protein